MNFTASNPTTDINFQADLDDERLFLQRLARKKDESTIEVDYVKALNDYDEAQLVFVFRLCLYQHYNISAFHMNQHEWSLRSSTYDRLIHLWMLGIFDAITPMPRSNVIRSWR